MKYSVVIPAYNAAKTINETLEAVLAQTASPADVIVVDDGSTDNTRRLVEDFGGCVRVLSQSNSGPGTATNLGMRETDTPLIAMVDADDLWLPHKMHRQIEYLEANDSCDGVFAQMELFGDRIQGAPIQEGWTRTTMVVRRSVYEGVGDVVDQPSMIGEMIDWIARARDGGFNLVMLPEVLARRRVARGTLSDRRDVESNRGYVIAARAALLRKRERMQETAPQ